MSKKPGIPVFWPVSRDGPRRAPLRQWSGFGGLRDELEAQCANEALKETLLHSPSALAAVRRVEVTSA
ncbi:hypothetical protein CLG85_012490 [Yangia mangrovi]|uniref:Uncharacterized protein n=1 Tax=Alloyangia mangrovi TaxID=1779329 RepID=A0A2A3JPJ8_9RHOB|nr:hypothetical protein [Alloyangia mangrovi]MCA0942105.1 hypothetical protein [Alloyangia pacifica]MCA0947134.1 hypothetical protein [Alloyangia pacifica]MCT4371088.1 hypothetical protein [Alloyangia mangrovi]